MITGVDIMISIICFVFGLSLILLYADMVVGVFVILSLDWFCFEGFRGLGRKCF